MKQEKSKLVINGNSLYEIDMECMNKNRGKHPAQEGRQQNNQAAKAKKRPGS